MKLALGAPVLVRGDAIPSAPIATLTRRMAETGKAQWGRWTVVVV